MTLSQKVLLQLKQTLRFTFSSVILIEAVKELSCNVQFFVQCAVFCAICSFLCNVQFLCNMQFFVHCALFYAICTFLYNVQFFVQYAVFCALCTFLCNVKFFVQCAVFCRWFNVRNIIGMIFKYFNRHCK